MGGEMPLFSKRWFRQQHPCRLVVVLILIQTNKYAHWFGIITVLENDKMFVKEFPAHSTLMDLFGRLARASSRWSGYSLAQKEELRSRLNHQPVELLDRFRKLMMGDIVELTPHIHDKSLSGYRDEIQRMYDANVVSASCETVFIT
ncbi:hypothetical protein ZOSMA_65G00920 [Zostera marina]|uniref:Uncharacterized protein n=1 Tax=Zostera marina TaxID=29655 RepID=A0A0K9NT09_ZOSMR|nr:hypothetical protein ZOSMA_65G00920 [Zostera marina]